MVGVLAFRSACQNGTIVEEEGDAPLVLKQFPMTFLWILHQPVTERSLWEVMCDGPVLP